jgi:hypothetical protein
MTAIDPATTADDVDVSLVVQPAARPAPAPTLRATKDINGIYHSNAGHGLMWVTFWVAVVAWIVLVGVIAAAAIMS